MTGNEDDRRYSARRPLLLGIIAVVALVGGLLGWGLTTSVDSAVIASAQVTVEARNQPIEHVDGGVVAEVVVADGDRVESGDMLLRFATGQIESEVAAIEIDLAALQARRSRLEAELRQEDFISWDVQLLTLSQESPAVQQILAEEERAFAVRINLRSQLAELQADRIASVSKTQEATALEAELLKLESERADEVEAQLLTASAQAQDLARRYRSARSRILRSDVLAPVSGTVFGLTVGGAGDVVRPAERLLYIVPDGAALIVAAQIQPIHVDRVHVGQEATIRFPAFSYQTTPERTGTVLRVSADAITDQRTGFSWYEAEVAIEAAAQDDELPLIPGMPAEVLISTGDRSVLSYLAKPITDFFSNSLREE